MNNPFEEIKDQISNLETQLQTLNKSINGEKRWLSTTELSKYIPYSKETINKKVQHGELIQGVHFYQQAKMRIFDKLKIDEWITNNALSKEKEQKKQEILSKIKSEI